VNADKTKIVLFTNNRKIGDFYNPRLFGTELRMTDQVKYLGVILDKKLDWKAHLENRIRKACIVYWQCRRAVEKTLGLSPKVVANSFVCFAGMVEESGAEKCSEKSLSCRKTCLGITGGMRSKPTSALEVMLMLPTSHLFIKQEARQVVNILLGNGCSYVPNFGHSEILIKMTDYCWLQGTNL
jgi:hypothetical protein